MSGRHRSYSAQQPSRNTRTSNRGGGGSSFPTGLVALGAVVVLAAGGAYVVYSKKTNDTTGATGSPSECGGATTTLTVGASPDIQSTIQQIANQAGGCVKIVVNADEPAVVASFLNGTGKAGDITSQPDVWIPDTSMWIDVARATPAGAGEVPATGKSVATSPVVLGMPKPIAPTAAFGWSDLLASQQSAKPIQMAVPDPTASGPGLAAITMVRGVIAAASGGNEAQANQQVTGIYRIMAANTKGSLSNLLADLPTSEATSADSSGIQAFPSTEQKIIQYNTTSPKQPVQLAAVYPKEGTAMMDYPYVEGTHLDAAHQKAANDFLSLLGSSASVSALQNAGFRDAHGASAGAITQGNGVNPALPALFPADTTHQAAPGALKVWATVSEQTRGLIVLDISGSMGLPVPGQVDPTTGATLNRLQLTAEACMGGLPLFGDTSELGLWTFTTSKTTGKTIHNQVVPLGPLNAPVDGVTRRAALNASLTHLQIQSGSRNGLYDTILDAYQNVLSGWSDNKSNAVVVFTDGKDDGLNSMTADALIGKINALKAANPNHPVRVIVVALGKGVDLTTLTRITAAADGKALYAATPDQIGAAVLEGFASRLGT